MEDKVSQYQQLTKAKQYKLSVVNTRNRQKALCVTVKQAEGACINNSLRNYINGSQ